MKLFVILVVVFLHLLRRRVYDRYIKYGRRRMEEIIDFGNPFERFEKPTSVGVVVWWLENYGRSEIPSDVLLLYHQHLQYQGGLLTSR